MKEKNKHYNQHAEIMRLAKKIAEEQIAPQASESDRKGTFPWEAIHTIGEVELPALVFSEKEGGLGEGTIALSKTDTPMLNKINTPA